MGKWQAIKAVPCGRWTTKRVRFVTSPFHCLLKLDRKMQPSCYKISRLLFADDLVLLSSSESGPLLVLDSFADACETAGMKISTAKTEILRLSRNPDHCMLQAKSVLINDQKSAITSASVQNEVFMKNRRSYTV